MRELQRRLTARGMDTGGTTGILGARTRAAVREVQRELGLPADAWPTPALLNRAVRDAPESLLFGKEFGYKLNLRKLCFLQGLTKVGPTKVLLRGAFPFQASARSGGRMTATASVPGRQQNHPPSKVPFLQTHHLLSPRRVRGRRDASRTWSRRG